jgi:endo-1,4-beta-xylanase
VNERQFTGRDSVGAMLIARQFNTITPENVLKWENVHPRPGVYDFSPADRYVEFGTRNGMFVIGHTLVWHSQVPRWVFQDARESRGSRYASRPHARPHLHRGRPLEGADQGLGRGERSAQR